MEIHIWFQLMCCNISKYFLRHNSRQVNTKNTTYNMFTMLLTTLWSKKKYHFFEMHRKEQYCYHNAKSFANWNLMFWNDTSYFSNSMVVTTTLAPFYVFLPHGQILWRCTSPIPKSIMNVKAFLPRLMGYYKNFIKNYGNIIESLFEFTKKDMIFCWDPHCQVAFDTLK